MPVSEVPSFIRDLRAMDRVWPMTRLALEFLILTAARSGEVRGARWEEFDLTERLWRVPAERMKTKRAHVVPLCDPAVELIQGAAVLRGQDGFVFAGTRGQPLSDNTLSKLMRDAGLSATPHGFRSTFKDWASEARWRDEVSEAALAHADTNRVRAAYRRTDFLAERRELMAAWAAVVLPRED
jgi:integrase